MPLFSPGADAPCSPDAIRTHKIVDGDSLAALAERYLGAADRWLEIYEANRDVLPGPGLLPIGAQLKIPPRRPPEPSPPAPAPRPRLVPLAPPSGPVDSE